VRTVVAKSSSDLFDDFDGSGTLGEALLEPTRIYVKPVLATIARSR
jgi:phosphoribosylaminoimidazole (AIR) synthetase